MDILVIDDDAGVRGALDRALRAHGFAVSLAVDGVGALEALERRAYDALVLDVMMPRLSGLSVCRALRGADNRVPILVLTAKDQVADRVAGLEAGADDYLVKPFALEELVARVRALLRRAHPQGQRTRLVHADVVLDTRSFEAWRGERQLDLRRMEFQLLQMFLEHPNQVLPRSLIYQRVWGYDFGCASNTLEVHVGNLRKKLEEDNEPRLIHAIRGVGYVLRAK